ncbi:MAG: glycosyltransferase [Chloroflexota bacterium]|nr:glycosyltransferase [Chloroflexota bacterium]
MHIAFLNPQGNFDPNDSYWTEHPDFGGQLVYVKEVAIAMAAQGHQVDILTRQIVDPEWPEFAQQEDAYPNVENVRILRLPCGPQHFLAKEQLWPYLGTEWVANIVTFYRSEGSLPDAFTAHYADGGLSGALLTQATGRPFTFTGHSLGAQKMDKLNACAENLAELDHRFHFARRILAERVSMSRAARIITSTQQERVEQYGHKAYRGAIDPSDETRFAVIPPGVNRKIFNPDSTEVDAVIADRIAEALRRDVARDRHDLPIVLASSRLDAKKNHVGLVRAFAESQKLQESANLAIAVRGLEDPLRRYASLSDEEAAIMDEIVALLNEYALWGKVTAFPLNSQTELAAAYRTMSTRRSVFALTALYEPFGLAPLEAMSCGLPAVVTKNGGPSESMIEAGREFGVLIDALVPADIARGLLRVVESVEQWEMLRDAGIERVVSKYTWDRTAEGYLGVIIKLQTAAPSSSIIIHPPNGKSVDNLIHVGGFRSPASNLFDGSMAGSERTSSSMAGSERLTLSESEIPGWFTDPCPDNDISLDKLADLYL